MTAPCALSRWPLSALATTAITLLAIASPTSAVAKESVSIERPLNAATVTGQARFEATTSRRARQVSFSVDGKRRWTDHRPKWRYGKTGYLDARALSAGRHRLTATATHASGRRTRDSVLVNVGPAGTGPATSQASRVTRDALGKKVDSRPAPAPDATPAASTVGSSAWSAGFEGPAFSEWSWWKRDDGGTFLPTSAQSEGIPALQGQDVARFEVTPAQQAAGQIHSKLLKNWAIASPETSWTDDAGRRLETLPGNSPAGVYRASFYLPENYSKSPERWTNMFQFKESYHDSSGTWHQDPQWWLNISRAGSWSDAPSVPRPDWPVVHVNHWNQDYSAYRPKLRALPLGRWFEIRAELYPGDRIDWYIDEQFFDRSSASQYPVGISKEHPLGWVFGVGHYDGIGKLWADRVSFAAR